MVRALTQGAKLSFVRVASLGCGAHTAPAQGSAPAASPPPPAQPEALRAAGHPPEAAHECEPHKGHV